MSFVIKDGSGSGREATVNRQNRLSVASVITNSQVIAASNGYRFNINTGNITLTNATNTSVIYLKNNEDSDLYITSIVYILGNSTGGTGNATFNAIRNPTAGSIITNANAVSINANYNFGSTITLDVDAYKGATGETLLSGGSTILSTILSTAAGRTFIQLDDFVLPKGSTIGVNYTPPSGNTSQIVQVAFAVYLQNFDT